MQWPIPPFPTKIANGSNVGVSSAGTANVKGAWATLLTGLPAPTGWICLGTPRDLNTGDRAYLLDLAIGGAGSETIVAADLVVGYRGWRGTPFPFHLPAGATLRGRIASQLTSSFMSFQVGAYMAEPDSGVSVPGRITTYGADTATSGGTLLTPTGSINVKGSWVQLTSATTSPIHALMVLAQGSTSAQSPAVDYAIDIGVGADGSETIIIPDHSVRVDTNELAWPYSPEFYPVSLSIPAGVRLAARCASRSGSQVTAVEVAVYGFTY